MRLVAFLRGINVGGHRVTGDQLVAVFEALGYVQVTTFLASGNVLFSVPNDDGAAPTNDQLDALAGRAADALEAALGYAVPTFLRTAAAVQAIAAEQPFSEADLAAAAGKAQVLLLQAAPSSTVAAAIAAASTNDDRLVLLGVELWWLPRLGVSGSVLGMHGLLPLAHHTARTHTTIERIAAKL